MSLDNQIKWIIIVSRAMALFAVAYWFYAVGSILFSVWQQS